MSYPEMTAGQQAFGKSSITSFNKSVVPICDETGTASPAKQALQLVCLRGARTVEGVAVENVVVIGFVGGFVSHDNPNRPEVQFASYLRGRYPAALDVEVFANRDGRHALRKVLHILDTNGDSALSATEKQQARIILYGHSWGASQAVTIARELGKRGIPVLLTIQVDSIAKLGQCDSRIPSNVGSAVNFYQSRDLLHGRSRIRAADPEHTNILGNFQLTYKDHKISCRKYPWLARAFSKTHHEIESDPQVWDQIAELIDSQLAPRRFAPWDFSATNHSQFDKP